MSEKFRSILPKNPNVIKEGLSEILDNPSLEKIQNEIDNNVMALFKLGINHYEFAVKLDRKDWRHKMSRFYYAAYHVARAIRFHNSGIYSTDSEDHKRIGDLPKGFPNKERYADNLPILRDDRNICDYNHAAVENNTEFGIVDSQSLVEDFIRDAKDYLKKRNFHL